MKSVEVSSEPLKGIVKNIVDFGLFIELPGHKDGLLHKNSLPNNLKTKFQSHFKEGQDIKVRITKQTEKGLQLELVE
jgi:ribosomal protein S1